MAYRIELSPKATVNIAKIRAISGSNWFSRFERAILTLEDMPERCAAFRQFSSSRGKVRPLLSGERVSIAADRGATPNTCE